MYFISTKVCLIYLQYAVKLDPPFQFSKSIGPWSNQNNPPLNPSTFSPHF